MWSNYEHWKANKFVFSTDALRKAMSTATWGKKLISSGPTQAGKHQSGEVWRSLLPGKRGEPAGSAGPRSDTAPGSIALHLQRVRSAARAGSAGTQSLVLRPSSKRTEPAARPNVTAPHLATSAAARPAP